METVTVDQCIEQLNSLLRGEISSVETYEQAIRKVDDEHASDAKALQGIAQEHGEAAQALRGEIQRLGGKADNSSGAWGVWAKIVEGTAKFFGDASALKALKEGEEHGLKDYREALDDVDESSRTLISDRLIPNQTRHIAVLDGMMAKIDRMGD